MKFKIYVGIMLFVIAVLLVGLDGMLLYGAQAVKKQTTSISNSISTKTSSFDQRLTNLNTSLQQIKAELQTQQTTLSTRLP